MIPDFVDYHFSSLTGVKKILLNSAWLSAGNHHLIWIVICRWSNLDSLFCWSNPSFIVDSNPYFCWLNPHVNHVRCIPMINSFSDSVRRPICIASRTHLKALHPNGLAYLARRRFPIHRADWWFHICLFITYHKKQGLWSLTSRFLGWLNHQSWSRKGCHQALNQRWNFNILIHGKMNAKPVCHGSMPVSGCNSESSVKPRQLRSSETQGLESMFSNMWGLGWP